LADFLEDVLLLGADAEHVVLHLAVRPAAGVWSPKKMQTISFIKTLPIIRELRHSSMKKIELAEYGKRTTILSLELAGVFCRKTVFFS
jgi:hypothetical protein